MPLAELRPTSRVVVQSFQRNTVQLCACELVDAHGTSLLLRALDDLPDGIAGQPVTLLTAGPDCLLRVAGQVAEVANGRIRVEVQVDETETVQRRRFARITGWLAVRMAQGDVEGPATLVDASAVGAAVLTNLDITSGPVTVLAEGHRARAEIVGTTRLTSGIRRLNLCYAEDTESTATAEAVMALLEG